MKPVRVRPEDEDDLYVATLTEPVYPDDYLTCTVCRVGRGIKCRSRSGRIVNGRPDGKAIELDRPHTIRRVTRRRVR